jgi:hypothetical protein
MGQTTIERDRPPPLPAHGDAALVRAIGLGGATLLVIGNVIGSAIFLTSGTMAAELQSASALVAVWVAGGPAVAGRGPDVRRDGSDVSALGRTVCLSR